MKLATCIFGALGLLAVPAAAAATCSCVISVNNLDFQSTPSGVVKTIPIPTNPYTSSQFNCHTACGSDASQNAQTYAQQFCNFGYQNGTDMNAYAMGSNPHNPPGYRQAWAFGKLVNIPAKTVTQWKCPATWNSNTTNIAGDVTADHQCKKEAGTLTIPPYPSDGTHIGTWGFTWQNKVVVYGSAANGGAATQVTSIIPAQCKF